MAARIRQGKRPVPQEPAARHNQEIARAKLGGTASNQAISELTARAVDAESAPIGYFPGSERYVRTRAAKSRPRRVKHLAPAAICSGKKLEPKALMLGSNLAPERN